MRRLSAELRPPLLEPPGLEKALDELASRIEGQSAIILEREICSLPAVFDLLGLTIYHCTLDTLEFARLRVGTSHITLGVTLNHHCLFIEVWTDGWDPAPDSAVRGSEPDTLLQGIIERLTLLPGTVELERKTHKGTRLVKALRLPQRISRENRDDTHRFGRRPSSGARGYSRTSRHQS